MVSPDHPAVLLISLFTNLVRIFLAEVQNRAFGQAIKLQSVASGVGAFANELVAVYADQCRLNIGNRCNVQVLLPASVHQLLGVAAEFVEE